MTELQKKKLIGIAGLCLIGIAVLLGAPSDMIQQFLSVVLY